MRRLLVMRAAVGQSGSLADKSSPKRAMGRPGVLDGFEVGSLGY